MKKILNVSVVAALAILPVVANAAGERSVTKLEADAVVDPSSTIATITYVQGAHKVVADKVDALIDDTAVAVNGNYIDAGKTVSANLSELDTAVKANADAIGAVEYDGASLSAAVAALQTSSGNLGTNKVNNEGNFTGANDSNLIAGKTIVNAIKDTATQVDTNTQAISDETTRAEGVEGSLDNLTTTAQTNLVAAINEVDSHADANAADIADIYNREISLARTWGSSTLTNIKISQLGPVEEEGDNTNPVTTEP